MPVELNGTPANKQDQTGSRMHVIFEPQDIEKGDSVIETLRKPAWSEWWLRKGRKNQDNRVSSSK